MVAEVTIVPPISQCELQGEGLKVSSNIGPRIWLAILSAYAEGATDSGPVDLLQELKWKTNGEKVEEKKI